MPELPEVESLCRAVAPIIEQKTLQQAEFFRSDLRFPIPVESFQAALSGQQIQRVWRRSKYMIWDTESGHALIHLGMTGNVLYYPTAEPQHPHTHAVFTFSSEQETIWLHYIDPRRFGWISYFPLGSLQDWQGFQSLGPEPLDAADLADYLWQKSRKKTAPIKNFLMDARILVGVGNIYANESLFKAGIRPNRPSGRVSQREFVKLTEAIKQTLREAIAAGGTSFRDFKNANGKTGYFALALAVYGREGEKCLQCESPILHSRLAGRATFYCAKCQR